MKWFCLILFIGLGTRANAQIHEDDDLLAGEYFIKRVVDGTRQFNAQHPTEKIYAHFDRPFYLVGDTAWFTIYVVDAGLRATPTSSAVFVDWFDEDGTLRKHQQFSMQGGKAAGSFPFVDGREGNYLVRVYTRLIADLDPDLAYYATLPLVNPARIDDPPVPKADATVDLQFFPEGGYLVYGIESKVAFRAIDDRGKGVDLEAQVLDGSGKRLTTLKTSHKGMGSFTLKPVQGGTYTVKLGNKTYQLPTPLSSGAVMNITSSNADLIEVSILLSEDRVPGKFYLIGRSQGEISFRDVFTVSDREMIAEVPVKTLSQGILQLTLFDDDARPLCERMVFIHRMNDVEVRITSAKSYAARELITLNIDVRDKSGNPVRSDVSVSVTDAEFGERNPWHRNIKTQLLLESDLRGAIEEPGWYFEAPGPDRTAGLDLVMLTHGWTKFTWQEILSERARQPYLPRNGLAINGRVIGVDNGKPVRSANITLITYLRRESKVYTTVAGDEGNFEIDEVQLNDSTRFVWQVRNRNGGQIDARVVFTLPKLPHLDSTRLASVADLHNVPANQLSDVYKTRNAWDSSRFTMLDEVEIRAGKTAIKPQDESGIMSNDYRRYSLKLSEQESLNYTDVTTMLRDKFPNIRFIGVGINQDVRIRGYSKVLMKEEVPPLILLDGQVISTDSPDQGGVYHALNIIPVSEIERIEVISGAAASIYGARGGSGVIAIYSKGQSAKVAVDPSGPGKGVLKVVPPGYESTRVFYQPKYTHAGNRAAKDNRITLYWNPQIKTDVNGHATIEFYNSDFANELQVVVEGMSDRGPVVGLTEASMGKRK